MMGPANGRLTLPVALGGSGAQICFSALQSAASRSGAGVPATATASIAAIRSLVSGWSSKSFIPSFLSPTMRLRMAASACGSPPAFGHQIDAVGVGRRLDPARIGRFQHRPRGDDHGAAADEIAEHHAEQERQAGGLQHGAGAVAMGDVADLVRQHAGQFVRRLRDGDQPVVDVDVTAGQRHGVGLGAAHHFDMQGKRQRCDRFELTDELVERGAAGRFARRAAAGEGRRRDAGCRARRGCCGRSRRRACARPRAAPAE